MKAYLFSYLFRLGQGAVKNEKQKLLHYYNVEQFKKWSKKS